MKRYKVTVNGVAYEIELEELTGNVPAPAAAPASSAPVTAAPSAGGEQITSPMPGTILSINFAQGAAVKKGDVLMILEAMKMENEIMSPCDGTLTAIHTSKGAAVETGTLLCVIQ